MVGIKLLEGANWGTRPTDGKTIFLIVKSNLHFPISLEIKVVASKLSLGLYLVN